MAHERAHDGLVSCARNTKGIALYVPSHPPIQLCQVNPIYGILTLLTIFSAQI